jgi:hypothetical protein
MNAWSHLPNARHIDRVLELAKSYPEIWDAARLAAWNAAWGAARYAAVSAARDAAMAAARHADWYEIRVRYTVTRTAKDAIAALIAYDDASKYLDMTSDHLRIWAILSEDSAAILLLPAVIAFERINELECV